MKKLSDEELRSVNLEMLIYFDEVCRKNNIHYSLTGGTLLGAIRHKGFIPWDDDVDVFMPRYEYEKLNECFSDDNRYIWKNRKKNPGFKFAYGRLLDSKTIILDAGGMASEGEGVFLDVYPVDGLPKNTLERIFHIKIMRFLYRCRRTVIYDKNRPEYKEGLFIVRLIKKIIISTTDLEFWLRKMEKRMSKYAFDASDYVGNFTSRYGAKEMMHRSSFESYIEKEFEGKNFQVCIGWEEYLKNIYGDYMRLPPRELRYGHHIGNAYWRE